MVVMVIVGIGWNWVVMVVPSYCCCCGCCERFPVAAAKVVVHSCTLIVSLETCNYIVATFETRRLFEQAHSNHDRKRLYCRMM